MVATKGIPGDVTVVQITRDDGSTPEKVIIDGANLTSHLVNNNIADPKIVILGLGKDNHGESLSINLKFSPDGVENLITILQHQLEMMREEGLQKAREEHPDLDIEPELPLEH